MTSTIEKWLDKVYDQDGIKGVILVDYSSGLSLGVRGSAQNQDAPYLKWYCESLEEGEDVAKVEYRDFVIFLKVDNNALIGIYKPLDSEESRGEDFGGRLSFEGT